MFIVDEGVVEIQVYGYDEVIIQHMIVLHDVLSHEPIEEGLSEPAYVANKSIRRGWRGTFRKAQPWSCLLG